jgi:2-hydroxychromene-2-carboxylate isomerase
LPARVACVAEASPWCGDYVRRVFVANFGEDRDIGERQVMTEVLEELAQPAAAVIDSALSPQNRGLLRANTERAMGLGIFGAPNCVVSGELFWGEESLEDAVAWAVRAAQSRPQAADDAKRP